MRLFREILQRENVVATALAVATFAMYCFTVSPTVSFVDSGELAAVASTLGIAHPTGYPLFTLLGRCAIMLPLAGEEVVRLDLLAALLTAAAVGWFFKTSLLLNRSRLFSTDEQSKSNADSFTLAAASGALVLAFSTTFWSQSVAAEVYSLHVLFLVLTSNFFLKGVEEQKFAEGSVSKFLFMFAFILGLGFTNHMTMLLLAPAFLFLYFRVLGWKREAFIRLLKLAPAFAFGLSLYLYLPVRASVQPPLDWGHPAVLERFFWHIGGKQYRSWMFSSFDNAERQFRYFTNNFPNEFHYAILVIFLLGIFAVVRRSGLLLFFLVLAFLGCVLYSINYDIHDIDSYFLLGYLVVGWFTVFGVNAFKQWLAAKLPGRYAWAVWIILLGLPAVQWWSNNVRVDQSGNFLVEDYTKNIFATVEPNAFILTYQWDYFVSASYYYQLVQQQRPDVIVIDKELLRRSWYFLMLEHRYPELIERSRTKVNHFLAELYKFEHNLRLDPEVIEARFNEMINDFIDKAIAERPVYVGNEIEPQFAFSYQRMPEGLLFRLLREGESPAIKPFSLTFRPTAFENDYTRGIRFLYARMLTMNAALMQEQKQPELALRTVSQALEIDASYQPALDLREQLRMQLSLP